jgi:hypothetical protein
LFWIDAIVITDKRISPARPFSWRDIVPVQDSKFRFMNNTPELVRLADSITSLAASIADLIQTQIKAAACNEDRKQAGYVSQVKAEKVEAYARPRG